LGVKNKCIAKCATANSILFLTLANSIKFQVSYVSNNHGITFESSN